MGKYILVLALLAALITGGCSLQQAVSMEKPADDVLASFRIDMAQAHNRFGFDVYRALPKDKQNVMISPFSLAMAFAMALNGADGETEAEMARIMGLDQWQRDEINSHLLALLYFLRTADSEVTLNIANSAWMKAGVPFEADYVQRLEEYLLARTETLDFSEPQAPAIINEWVNRQTRGMIPVVVEPPIDPLTILYLINAVYFDGNWTTQFNRQSTTEEGFFNLDGSDVIVPMMNQTGSLPYYETDTFQLVRIPYGQEERISMSILLPRENISWEEFSTVWNLDSWNEWRKSLSEKSGVLALPRFEFSYESSLIDTLTSIGLHQAFQPDSANFGRMVNPSVHDDLHISDVIHKTRIRVGEEGTEAAAVTSIEMGVTSIPAHDFTMQINRPFIFVISDEDTGTILFLGHVTDLTQQ
jgi:serine protease inhibitor